MGPVISAITYIMASLVATYVILIPKPLYKWQKSTLIFWCLITIVLFSTNYYLFTLLTSLILIFILKTKSNMQNLLFYISIITAVPLFVSYKIPFPGVNYLFAADILILSSLVILVPIVLSQRKSDRWVEFPIWAFFVLASILSARHLPFTGVLRGAFEQFFVGVVPFLAFYRAQINEQNFEKILVSFLTVGLIFGSISIFIAISQWNFYGFVDQVNTIRKYGSYRYGILRTGVTIAPIMSCFIASVGVLCLILRRKLNNYSLNPPYLANVFLLTVVIVFSLSRGGWLGALAMFGLFFLFSFKVSNSKIVAISISILLGFFTYTMTVDVQEIDQFGTFEYRQLLFTVSFEQFLANPLFGEVDYRDNDRFRVLIQGEGIVDVTSVYLNILLEFGIFGFILYFLPYIVLCLKLIALRSRILAGTVGENLAYVSAILAITIAYLIVISTVSRVSIVGLLGFIWLGIGFSFVREAGTAVESKLKNELPDQSRR